MKGLIVTGDDFGIAKPVNQAILEAHKQGILTAASLMTGGGAKSNAVSIARGCPSLRVGLHIVLVDGRAVSPLQLIPDLVDSGGEFSPLLVRAGFRFFFRPGIRKQLETEIRAQFEAFQETGLTMDHVNAHNHMHLHPTVLHLILKVGTEFGISAVRLPNEPALLSWRASRKRLGPRLMNRAFLLPWICLMKRMLKRRGLYYNDCIFGMADTGAMTPDLVLRLVERIPDGITEMYFHPAKRPCPEIERTMPGYLHEEEFKSLTDPVVCNAVRSAGIKTIAFGDMAKIRSAVHRTGIDAGKA